MALWLVRHGQSGWNVAGRIQGQSPDAPGLTPIGCEQAAQAARELRVRAPRAGLIVASDLARAAETAEIIAGRLGLPAEADPGLREQALGSLEGLRLDDPRAAETVAAGEPADKGPDDVLDELWRHPFHRPPGGESVADMYGRVHGVLDRSADQRGEEVIIVTHGGPVRVAMVTPPPAPGRPVPREAVANASITRWVPREPGRGSPVAGRPGPRAGA